MGTLVQNPKMTHFATDEMALHHGHTASLQRYSAESMRRVLKDAESNNSSSLYQWETR